MALNVSSTRLPTVTQPAVTNPTLVASGNKENKLLDMLQGALDLGGFVPGFGELADAANAGIYALRGDYLNAGLSAISMVPVIGDAVGKGAKGLLAAAKTPVSKEAAKKLFQLLGKIDLKAFYSKLETVLSKVPQVGSRAKEAVKGISKGIDQVMTTIADKFGLPKPMLASVEGGGNLTPPNRPNARPTGTSAADAAKAARQKLVSAGVETFSKTVGKMDKLSALASKADTAVQAAVKKAFNSSLHLTDHVVTNDATGMVKLGEEFTTRANKFSAFPSVQAAKDAATTVMSKAKEGGIDLLNPRALPEGIRKLADGEQIVLKGIKFTKADGKLAAEYIPGVTTGAVMKLGDAGVDVQKANAIKLIMSKDGLSFTSVYPVVR